MTDEPKETTEETDQADAQKFTDRAPAASSPAADEPDRPVDYGDGTHDFYGAGSNDFKDGQKFRFQMPDSGRGGQGPPKVVEIMEPTTDIVEMSLDMAATHAEKGDMAEMHAAQLEQIRHCLKRFGDRQYAYKDLQGSKLDAELTQYERSYIMQAMERLTTPTDRKVRNFLETMEPV